MNQNNDVQKHVVLATVENEPGVLNLIVSLFRRGRFNIEGISAGHTEKEGITKIAFTVDAKKTNVEQLIKQVEKIVNVLSVEDVTFEDIILAETVLIKLEIDEKERAKLNTAIEMYQATIEDIDSNSVLIQIVGAPDKIDKFIEEMKEYKIKEMFRSGTSVMVK